ncbi:MAG: serine/threonine-protein kinase, partial [Actinomycetota bacterium]
MTSEVDLGIDDLSDYQTIGTGGFSTVMSAWDEGFRRRVAIKVIHSLDEAGRRRFERERGIMGQLSSHTNVIMPFRAGYTATGAPYLVMELVDGGSLEDLAIDRGPIPWREAIDYILPATAALGHAHQQGILHRDVKPANILLAGATPKLTDFGIAALRESTASVVAYTLSHCPPETFATGYDNRDERSDLYSMASTLYTLLTGGFAPYDAEEPDSDSQQAYMFRIIGHDLPEVPAHLEVPESLRQFLRAALSKDPQERPQSAAEFSAQLREIVAAADRPTVFGGPGDPASSTANTLHHQPLDPDHTRPMQLPTPPLPTH